MFTPTLRCECAQPASDRLMRKWCIYNKGNKPFGCTDYLHNSKVPELTEALLFIVVTTLLHETVL